VLAVLQYRWVGEFSEAERQRMRTSAQERADRFAEDFDSALTALYFAFSMPADVTTSVDYPARCAEQYGHWAATSFHARLVRAAYLVRTAPAGHEVLQIRPTGTFEPVAWPPALDALKGFLPGGGTARTPTLFGTTVPAVPALIVPLTRLQVTDVAPADPGKMRIVNVVGVAGFLALQLDRDYITREWLPSLARRYFPDRDGDYHVAVVESPGARQFVFASDPGLKAAVFAKPDVKAPLFRVRLEQAARFFGEATGLKTGGPTNGGRPTTGDRPTSGERPANAGLPDAGVPGAEGRRIDGMRVTVATRHETTIVASGVRSSEWQLVLAHRAGSLEAAVARSRHRNLAVSFGILAVLAVSLALIVLSARRAATLARQQIEFVAGVSHELRTPLSVIRSAGENLSDGVIHDPAHVKRYGAIIADEGRRLTELVEQVMSFAGFESGRDLHERADIAVEDLVEGAITCAKPLLTQNGFTVDRRVAAALPSIRVNVAALTRAIENLIANAVKYSGTSRWIGVSAEAAPATRGGCEVLITVADRGVGIQPDEQRHVFEPFYRGRGVVASPIRGSGLGLSLAKRIIEAHGGSISLRSEPGQGSAFTLHVPCAPAGQAT
jgi:signal transduction histidine kinase